MNRLAGALVAAPILLFGYGAVRLLDPTHSPGPVWTVSHLLYLAAFPALGLAAVALYGLLADRGVGVRCAGFVLVVAGWVGVLSGIGQAVIDLLAGQAVDKAQKAVLASQWREAIPGSAFFYGTYPSLAQVAVVGLLALAATGAARRVAWWAAPLVLVAGLVPTVVSLDLIPVAALAILPAVWPVHRQLRAGSEQPRPTLVPSDVR